MRARDIIYILISGVVIRAFLEIYVVGGSYLLSLANQAVMYLLVLLVIYLTVGSRDEFFSGFVPGKLGVTDWMRLSITPFALVSFSLGSIALAAYLLAQIDPSASYRHYNFYSGDKNVHDFLSWSVISYLVVNGVIAPLSEEIVFRKFLFRSISQNRGKVAGVILSSLAFSLLHFGSTDYFGVFVFSVVLCVVFIRFNSILVCAAIHSAYNVSAFLHQYYFDTFWKREFANFEEVSGWVPHFFLLLISTLLIFYLVAGWVKRSSVLLGEPPGDPLNKSL